MVLNGCRDNTIGVVQRVAREFQAVGWLDFPAPIGKGGALIEGLKHAGKVDYVGYVDADGATGPAHVPQVDSVPEARRIVSLLARAGCRTVSSCKNSPPCGALSADAFISSWNYFSGCTSRIPSVLCKLFKREAVEKIR